MRAAIGARLDGHPGFRLVDGAAEATGLPARSVDFVTAAQAFHWFDHAAARAEFRRILAPGGRVALIWNNRRRSGTPFLDGYERLLQEFGIDYERVDHPFVINPEVLGRFFGPRGYRRHEFPNRQVHGLRRHDWPPGFHLLHAGARRPALPCAGGTGAHALRCLRRGG